MFAKSNLQPNFVGSHGASLQGNTSGQEEKSLPLAKILNPAPTLPSSNCVATPSFQAPQLGQNPPSRSPRIIATPTDAPPSASVSLSNLSSGRTSHAIKKTGKQGISRDKEQLAGLTHINLELLGEKIGLQKEIDQLQKEIGQLRKENQELTQMVNKLASKSDRCEQIFAYLLQELRQPATESY